MKDVFNNPTIKDIYDEICMRKDVYNIIDVNNESDDIVRLKHNSDKNVFAFPSIVGYGYVYIYLSKLINDYSFYALNFIDDEEVINQYVNSITNINKDQPIKLLGYSAGGRLSFDVAKALEKAGYEVSDIIVVDAGVSKVMDDDALEDAKSHVFSSVKSFLNLSVFYNLSQKDKDSMGEKIINTCEAYMKYDTENITTGKINSNIHVITSAEDSWEEGHYDYLLKWKEHTTKEVLVYNGYGKHEDMMVSPYVDKNAELINKILNL